MSLSGLKQEIQQIQQKTIIQRRREREILQAIAAMTSPKFAEQAASVLDSGKHLYDFGTYLALLERLQRLILIGTPNCIALEAVQTRIGEDMILQVINRKEQTQ